jgi:hypothetical protein
MNMNFFKYIEQLMELGIRLDLYIDSSDHYFCADLNTQGKSSCVLKREGDKVIAYRRYNRVDEVKDLEQLIALVHGCAHGRSYFSGEWLKVFEDRNLTNPCG